MHLRIVTMICALSFPAVSVAQIGTDSSHHYESLPTSVFGRSVPEPAESPLVSPSLVWISGFQAVDASGGTALIDGTAAAVAPQRLTRVDDTTSARLIPPRELFASARRTPVPIPETWARSQNARSAHCVRCCRRGLCDTRCRDWTVSTGAIFLYRTEPESRVLFDDPADPTQRLRADDFDFGGAAGIEASVIAHSVWGPWDVECRYFGLDDWSDRQFVHIAGSPLQLRNNPVTFLSGPRDVTSTYSSELHNLEVNLRRTVQSGFIGVRRVTVLAGFRYLQLNESLNSRFVSTLAVPDPTQVYNIDTTNDLYGFQLGLTTPLCGGCNYCVEGLLKCGLYGNDASQHSRLFCCPGPVGFRNHGDKTNLAFLIEAAVSARFRLVDRLNVYTSGNMMWLDGVSLASDQVAATGFAGNTDIDANGHVFYVGGTVGLELVF